jgi:hypothetical protein
MNRVTASAAACAALLLSACGSHGSSSNLAGATVAPTTTGTSTTPPRTLSDAHGELVVVAGTAGPMLAFQEDGAPDPYAITDPSALVAAGLHEGHTLAIDGEVSPSTGSIPTPESVRITSFDVDDTVLTSRLEIVGGGVMLKDRAGTYLIPIGPLSPALLAAPLDRPMRVTGRIDPNYPVGVGLIVTSWRPTETLGRHHFTPLLGYDSFDVDDLPETGAYRAESAMAMGPGLRRSLGDGRRLDATALTGLRSALVRANLRSQPATFRPAVVYPDHPTTRITFADAAGDVSITIWSGATLPRDLEALVQLLQGLPATVPMLQTLERGDQSLITQASTRVARTNTEWDTLWRDHSSGSQPRVDFTTHRVVGVFDGFRSTGGYSVEFTRMEKIGPHLHFGVTRTSPTGPAPSVLTYPFHLVSVEAPASAEVYVEGTRIP